MTSPHSSRSKTIEVGYDDSGWDDGRAPLGYDESASPKPPTTELSYGGDADDKHRTTYFRRSFHLANAAIYDELRLQVWRNDGVAIYLNGNELFRNNLSSSYLDHDSYAERGVGDEGYVEILVPSAQLLTGENVLAAEVHIAASNDQTLRFDAALRGVLSESEEAQLIGARAPDWRYLHTTAGVGDSLYWKDPDYSDVSWQLGDAKLGYGDDNQETLLVSDTNQVPPAAYFRKRFDAAPGLTHLRFELLADDGAVVYVNGAEAFRVNMPSGELTDDSTPIEARGSSDENRYQVHEFSISELTEPLNATDNLVAIAVYQHAAELTDRPAVGALTRAGSTFPLRLLLHVDESGQVRLLKEAIVMYDESAAEPVIVADHTRIPEFSGVTVRGAESVGIRLSAVSFDFGGSSLDCAGALATDGSLACEFTLTSNHPTNPFLHRYHPDHDNLDARYAATVEEAYAVTRDIRIDLASRFPPDLSVPEWSTSPPGWGDKLLGGVYTEKFKGLHRDPITVNGPLILQRVSTAGSLK